MLSKLHVRLESAQGDLLKSLICCLKRSGRVRVELLRRRAIAIRNFLVYFGNHQGIFVQTVTEEFWQRLVNLGFDSHNVTCYEKLRRCLLMSTMVCPGISTIIQNSLTTRFEFVCVCKGTHLRTSIYATILVLSCFAFSSSFSPSRTLPSCRLYAWTAHGRCCWLGPKCRKLQTAVSNCIDSESIVALGAHSPVTVNIAVLIRQPNIVAFVCTRYRPF